MLRFSQVPSGDGEKVTNLNTSHVTVQPKKDNNTAETVAPFKYIPCYGSAYLVASGYQLHLSDLNTSHVTVQPLKTSHSFSYIFS